MQDEEQSKDSNSDEDILAIARKRFDLAVDAEQDNRKLAIEDQEFRVGDQWPADIKAQRNAEAKPCLTINRLPQFIQQITNDQRQNRPSIKVSPVDSGADIETAKIFQGLIRHIEYNSNADVAYDTAFDNAASGGLGYFRVVTEYCDPYSFEQDIKIKRIRNRFTVYVDPFSQEPDGSDYEWATIFEDIPWDVYRAKYKDAKYDSAEDWSSTGDTKEMWANEKSVRVAEYFYKTYETATMVQLENGFVCEKSKLPEDNPYKILKERQALLPKIKWVLHNGKEILDSTDWPGQWIPIIPVVGNEIDVDGKRILEGVIRHAKDPQRMYNYWASAETEMIALAPKAPFIGAEGQFKGKEDQWKNANRRNYAYLEYCPVTIAGTLAPPPQRNVYEAPVMAITNARSQSAEDLKSTTGIYDAGLGNRSNENSGIAIQRRAAQSQTANFHFVDNLARSIRHLGRILVDLIPHVYDTPRAGRILGEDGETEIVPLNEIFQKNGEAVQYNLSKGKYDVTVSTGPSYATKRQEAADTMMEFLKAVPNAAQLCADIVASKMDWPGAQDMAERLKKGLPPGIAEDKNKEQKPLPPEVTAQMQQMSQMVEQLTHTANEQAQIIEQKKMELESRERIEFKKLEVQMALKELETGSKESLALLAHEIQSINARLEMVGMNEPIDIENENEMEAGAPGAVPPIDNQQPTGGPSPGEPLE